jgi:uncharacterized membrane protein YhaH (DUF805 family)
MSFVSLLFSLEGRIGRAKYWLGQLVLFVVLFVSWLALIPGLATQNIPLLLVPIALLPFSLWMSICVAGKRYHDRGKSAWWILICLIPIVGGIWQFIELGLLRGDDGTNDYGPDPIFSFNVAGDIEALRQAGQSKASLMNRPTAIAASAPARAPARSPYTDGRPVFGKRV